MKKSRKKGCPFCKASPDRCCVAFDGPSRYVWVRCMDCGAGGPEESLYPTAPADVMNAVWLKWNDRG